MSCIKVYVSDTEAVEACIRFIDDDDDDDEERKHLDQPRIFNILELVNIGHIYKQSSLCWQNSLYYIEQNACAVTSIC